MNLSPRTLLPAAGAFIGAGVLAFLGGQALGGDDAPLSAAVPTVQVAEPVILPVLVSPDEDVTAFAVEHAAQAQALREMASELGVPLESIAESADAIGVSNPIPATSDAPPEPPGEPEVDPPDGEEPDGDEPETGEPAGDEPSAGPPGRAAPGIDTVEDACADGGDDCPLGVGGTVLAAIRAVPPLVGVTIFDPSAEPGPNVWTPQCPAIDVPSGSAYFGVTTSRPATINLRYRAGGWTGSAYEVEGEVTITTPDDAEGPWEDWIADDTAAGDDPRGWITHCFLIEDLPPRPDYRAYVYYADKNDPSITDGPDEVAFRVLLDSGFAPGERRRPTYLLGIGIDDLLVGVTAREDHSFVAYAIPDGAAGVCDTGGDAASLTGRPGAVRSVQLGDEPIPTERIGDPEYPYLRDHTRGMVHRLNLQEGTDYMVCLYWFPRGTTFNPGLADIAEAAPVSTPEAYRPRVLVHGITGLFGALGHGQLVVEGCGHLDFVIEPGYRAGDSQMFDEPVELCIGDRRLTSLERMRVVVYIEDTDAGLWRSGGAWIRTPLQCDPVPCLLRLDEYYSVPLPAVPTERRLCGTGFGGGCSGEVPMRSAGAVAMEVEFVRTPGNGLSDWSIGSVGEFEATPPTPPEPVGGVPRLVVDVAYELGGHPTEGARATVTVTADREVTFSAHTVGEPDCGLEPPGAHSSDTFATVHTFVLEPLCLGNAYRLGVIAYDRTRGAVGTIIEPGAREVGPETTLVVPPLLIYADMTTTFQTAITDRAQTAWVRAVNVSVPTVHPPYGTTLDWAWSADDGAAAMRNGWDWLGALACSRSPGAGPLTVNTPSRTALVAQAEITLTAVIDVFENLEPGPHTGECARGRQVDSYVMQATVTLQELMDGVTVTAESGEATFTIRVTRFRSELVG